jgi:trans-2,3-dihydro-3-hydroxyanthranilate isomerase
MSSLDFYIVDVFAIGQYTGNQLAVFRDADRLSLVQMQQIAKEINFSESTFITSISPDYYSVKIFTPKVELPFAGHPTLGTAWVIQQFVAQQNLAAITIKYTAGQIPVTFNYVNDQPDVLWMQQKEPEFLGELTKEQLAPVLQIDPADIADYPICQVSTGLPFIIVPLKTLAAVQKAQLELASYYQLIAQLPAQSILIFCPETLAAENDLHVRVFTHALGIPEDPATGSANGCLAAYLVQYSYQGRTDFDWQVEQGYSIDRPSLLYVRSRSVSFEEPQQQDAEIRVSVGGKVRLVATGQWLV